MPSLKSIANHIKSINNESDKHKNIYMRTEKHIQKQDEELIKLVN